MCTHPGALSGGSSDGLFVGQTSQADPDSERRFLLKFDAAGELGSSPDGLPDWRLRALHTPGHDRGHLALLETRHRTLIAGDMLSTLSTIVIDPPEGHLATYLASLARLVELAPRVLVPAHGPAHPRAVELLEAYLEHRGVRERALLRELGHGPAPLQALLPRVYADVADALLPVAARSLQAGLEKLQEEGRAQEHAGRWELVPGGPPLA